MKKVGLTEEELDSLKILVTVGIQLHEEEGTTLKNVLNALHSAIES